MARDEPAGWVRFRMLCDLITPLVVVPPPRPSQREGKVAIVDRILIVQLGYCTLEKRYT